MRKLPEHSRVRRRLFPDDTQDQASIDNFANILQEITKQEIETKTKIYNFDFVKDEPLEGEYDWFKRDGDCWIGVKPRPVLTEVEESEDELIPIVHNETTPNINTNDRLPLVRKRKRETSLSDNGARRKISFD